MPLAETVALALSASIANSILKAWLGEGVTTDALSAIIDIVKDRGNESIDRRDAQTIDRVGQRVADDLRLLWDAERLPDDARRVVAHELATTLLCAPIDADLLVATRYDPAAMSHRLEATRPELASQLSQAESDAYQRLLLETSRAVLRVTDSIKNLNARSFADLLTGQDTIIASLDEVKQSIASILAQLAAAPASSSPVSSPPSPSPEVPPMPAPLPPFDRADLLALLKKRLLETDLKEVAFILDVPYSDLGGDHTPRPQRIINLYEMYEARDDLHTLFAAIHHVRDDIPLPGFPAAPKGGSLPAATPAAPSTSATAALPDPRSTRSVAGSVFISHSSRDEVFARQLHADLTADGVECWFAPEDLPIGAKTRDTIYKEIGQRAKLLLILSENSVASDWVEEEVSKALDVERREARLVLFPIRIDDTVMTTDTAWAETVRIQRNIGNFTEWRDPTAYQKALARVLRDLEA